MAWLDLRAELAELFGDAADRDAAEETSAMRSAEMQVEWSGKHPGRLRGPGLYSRRRRVLAAIATPSTVRDVARRTGLHRVDVEQTIRGLRRAGLAHRVHGGWRAT